MSSRRSAIYLIIIGSLVGSLATGRAVFLTIALLFGFVFLLAMIWAFLAVRGISVQRRTQTRRSQVGRTFRERFIVRNTNFLPKLWLEVRDHSDLPGHRASHVVPGLSARGSYKWDSETQCVVRGEFRLGPMTILSGDPFGFFLSPRRISATERIIVYPAMVTVTRFHLPTGLLTGGDPQRQLTQHVTTNAAGVREYVPGDSINRIHWKSTARRNKLIVKEFELDPQVDVWILTDFSRHTVFEAPTVQRVGQTGTLVPGTQSIPASTEEYSVIVAASLSKHFIEIERALGFVAYTPKRDVFHPERGHRQMTRILETLAVARSTADLTLKEMLALESTTFTRGTSLVLITASLDPDWVAELQLLTRRGIRPTVVFIEPTSFGHSESSERIKEMLHITRIPCLIIKQGDDLASALSQRPI